jgi:hypothetical protein
MMAICRGPRKRGCICLFVEWKAMVVGWAIEVARNDGFYCGDHCLAFIADFVWFIFGFVGSIVGVKWVVGVLWGR